MIALSTASFVTAALLGSLLMTLVVERVCHRLLLFDNPGDRKIHKRPVPRLGGLSFFLIPFLMYWFVPVSLSSGFLLGAVCVYVGGFYDDLNPANSALVKLAFQVPAALLFAGLLPADHQVFSGEQILVLRGVVAAYVLFMINAANLMDNMNGLTAGLSMIWLSGLAWIAQNSVLTSHLVIVLLIITASVLGFYIRNFPWGKIYMGDQGSQLLGFIVAGFSIQIIPTSFGKGAAVTIWGSFLVLLLFSSVFVLDVLTVTVIRLLQGRPVWRGDQSHLSHQLVSRGLSQTQAALVLSAAQLGFVVAGIGLVSYLRS